MATRNSAMVNICVCNTMFILLLSIVPVAYEYSILFFLEIIYNKIKPNMVNIIKYYFVAYLLLMCGISNHLF